MQLDLFTPAPRGFDEARLLRRLRETVTACEIRSSARTSRANLSRAAIRRLMTPLPRITALD
jgi:hypothetical protein